MVESDTTKQPTGLELYTQAAQKSAREVIYSYSTSFGLATRLIDPSTRRHIESIYAMVRVADEIVDGSAAQAAEQAKTLDPEKEIQEFENNCYKAMELGYSTNLVLHAFGITAREVGIKKDIVKPFFDSMKMDLTDKQHDEASFKKYVYGSAEVVGLMCLRAFIHDREYNPEQLQVLNEGALALGSAFQKVNFLRDLSADFSKLGRSYFPNVDVDNFDEETKKRLVDDIESELNKARNAIPLLPKTPSRAVKAACELFGSLNKKISKTQSSELISTRISVSNGKKFLILAKSYLGAGR
ncbi:MAG TPA: squalene/phytoene synthase family protein [Microbacteriaceae bacterium]